LEGSCDLGPGGISIDPTGQRAVAESTGQSPKARSRQRISAMRWFTRRHAATILRSDAKQQFRSGLSICKFARCLAKTGFFRPGRLLGVDFNEAAMAISHNPSGANHIHRICFSILSPGIDRPGISCKARTQSLPQTG